MIGTTYKQKTKATVPHMISFKKYEQVNQKQNL